VANRIKIRRGSGTPTTNNTEAYELAYDYSADILYIHDGASNTMVPVGTGTVDTSGTPVDNDFAKFTDANTIEGRSAAEVKSDLGLGTGAELNTAAVSDGATTLATGNAIYDHVTSRISGFVDKSGTPIASEYARFTDSNTIQGISAAGVRTDLGLVVGTNVQAQNDYLQDIADLSTDNAAQDGYVLAYNNAYPRFELVEQSGGISFNGSTANGLLTYGNSTTADVESALTFDGSALSVTGTANVTSTLSTDYGVRFNNGNTDFMFYNNTGDNLLYLRDLTNAQMLQTWTTSSTTIHKNLNVSGNVNATGDINVSDDVIINVNANYIYSRDASGTLTRMFGMNSGNTTYIGPIDSYAGGSVIYGISSNVLAHYFYTDGAIRMKLDGPVLDIPNTGDWSYIKNGTTSGGLRFGTNDSSGTYANQIEISNTGNYVKLNENTTVTGDLTTSGSAIFAAAHSYDKIKLFGSTGHEQIGTEGSTIVLTASNFKFRDYSSGATRFFVNSSGAITTGVWQGTAIASSYIADNAINAAKLNVSGNGSDGQLLKSDGDGTFSWFSLVSSSNASTLDNLDSTQFLRSDTGDTAAGNITFTGKLLGNSATTSILNGASVTNVNDGFTNDIGTGKAEGLQPFRYSNNTTNTPLGGGGSMANNANWGLSLYSHGTGGSGNYGLQMSGGDNDNQLFFIRRVTNGSFGNWFEMWHSGNDGSGSGLDADLLDGLQGSSYWTKSGSWAGDLTSNGWSRVQGVSNGGGEFVLALKNGQLSTLIDGSYFAYEAGTNTGGGFWSSSNSSYGAATGIIASGGTLYVKQADGGNASLFVTGDAIVNSGYISGQGNDLQLRRTTNSDDRIVIEASETKIYGDAVERVRFGSYGIRNGYDGTNSAPAYSFKDDTDTGMRRNGSGVIDFINDGIRRLRIEADGDLVLSSDGSTQGASIHRIGGLYFTWDRDSYGTNQQHAILCSSDDLIINSFDNVTINLDSNDNDTAEAFQVRRHGIDLTSGELLYSIDQSGNSYTMAASQVGNGSVSAPSLSFFNDTNTGFYRKAADQIGFVTAGEQQMYLGDGLLLIEQPVRIQFANDQRIFDDGGGGLKVGAEAHKLQLFAGSSTQEIRFLFGGRSGTEKMRFEGDGDGHFDGDVIAFSTTPSDIRLKKNFTKIKNGLEVVNKLEGHTFNWKKGGDRLSAGFKAQEVEKILPHLVDEKKLPLKADDDKEYKILRYEEMIPYLVEAIKEQQVQIDELKTQIGEQNG
jgi:hypothetical protein